MFVVHQQPSLNHLNYDERCSVAKKWYDLGIELLHSNDIEELDRIKAEHPSDHYNFCTKMFELWLKKQPTASWNQLIKASRQPGVELGWLASRIEHMVIKPRLQG